MVHVWRQVEAASSSPYADMDGVSYAWRAQRSSDGGMVDEGPHAVDLRAAGGTEHVSRVECATANVPGATVVAADDTQRDSRSTVCVAQDHPHP